MGGFFSRSRPYVNDAQILQEVQEHPVVMYTKTSCSYCKRAKALLDNEKVSFEEKDLDVFNAHFPERYQEYVNGLVYLTHQTSVPQVFICGRFIGGFTELNALNTAGRMHEAIAECKTNFGKTVQ